MEGSDWRGGIGGDEKWFMEESFLLSHHTPFFSRPHSKSFPPPLLFFVEVSADCTLKRSTGTTAGGGRLGARRQSHLLIGRPRFAFSSHALAHPTDTSMCRLFDGGGDGISGIAGRCRSTQISRERVGGNGKEAAPSRASELVGNPTISQERVWETSSYFF